LQLALVNIDGELVTQGVRIWELGGEREERVSPRCSVVIVCARYARRLEACLNGLAHQQGVEPGEVEVMLAYVPGIDATEDVIDSFQAAHPELRILRAPFAAAYASSKGKLINETVANAMGDWVVLLDADIVLPSDALARLGELPAETAFAAPAGRKMLGREDTARVLLGELRPWEDWDSVMAGPGEVRGDEGRGAPIGYMQCVRRPCFEIVRYDEYGHFEGADWQFGEDMRRQYGEAARLDGLIVAHLDHGGSHWYGADKHR
jgi:glycosyltransferase involved in cell wall biosynthesis